MMISSLQGQFMQALVHTTRAKRILEIGCFTGSSALWMAQGFQNYHESQLITLDMDYKAAEIARSYFKKVPYGNAIQLIIGPAMET
jgi:caffeoyl-CoA O-methyltransferase